MRIPRGEAQGSKRHREITFTGVMLLEESQKISRGK
jgi:hypothetical protein